MATVDMVKAEVVVSTTVAVKIGLVILADTTTTAMTKTTITVGLNTDIRFPKVACGIPISHTRFLFRVLTPTCTRWIRTLTFLRTSRTTTCLPKILSIRFLRLLELPFP